MERFRLYCSEDGIVELWSVDLGSPMLLFLGKGARFSNQTGGYACHHPVEEVDELRVLAQPEEKLKEFFTGEKWGGWCCTWGVQPHDGGIDEETALFVEDEVEGFKVDRARMEESEEAWIYGEYEQRKAVLTWANSD